MTEEEKIISASPKVRKFARELGADISEITGSERKGRITEKDIKEHIKENLTSQTPYKKKLISSNEEFDHSKFGEIDVVDIPRVKKLATPHLMNAWTNIPHVTHHDEADITEMDEFRNTLFDRFTGEKKKITPLAFITKALVLGLKNFPNFNSSIDKTNNEKIVVKKYYHIGIAVDTDYGLMVPKIRDVDTKNINQINDELKLISEKCRKLKIDKKEFFGGSMTITSLGGIGGSFFTPIINYPEVAILGIGKSFKKQIFYNKKFQARTVLPLSLSYDHRIIDGADAARFCNYLKEILGKDFAYKLAI